MARTLDYVQMVGALLFGLTCFLTPPPPALSGAVALSVAAWLVMRPHLQERV